MAAVIWSVGGVKILLRLGEQPFDLLVVLLLLLSSSLLIVAFRFWRVLAHLGYDLPWAQALKASIAGNIAALLFVPLLSQVIGRQAVLSAAGLSSSVNASVAAYERVILAVCSGIFAFLGAVYLFGQVEVELLLSSLHVSQILLVVLLGYALSFIFGGGRNEGRIYTALLNKRNVLRLLEVLAITLVGHAMMLACYAYGFHRVAPALELPQLIAAASVVSFAASLPISMGGWGVREGTAAYVFHSFGLPAADAVLVSILIGLCSNLVLMGAVPLLSRLRTKPSSIAVGTVNQTGTATSPARIGAWILALLVLCFTFFQAYIPFPGGVINVNLADPFALLALSVVILQSISTRSLPAWRLPGVNRALMSITVVLLFAFVVGWNAIGVTQWAMGGRVLGLVVLLGYFSVGHLLLEAAGEHARRRACEILLSVGSAVILVQVALRLMLANGVEILDYLPSTNFEGYLQNRNAFGFQLLLVIALVLGYSHVYARSSRSHWRWRAMVSLQGLLLLGLVFSASRANMAAAAILMACAWILPLADRRFIGGSLTVCVLSWLAVVYFPMLLYDSTAGSIYLQSAFSGQVSGDERLEFNALGMQLWRESPFSGIGLGVFYERSSAVFGSSKVIHSTPIWILVEFGLIGAVLLILGCWRMVLGALKNWAGAYPYRAFLLISLGFCMVSVFHEVMFQRMFWLVAGLLLASHNASQSIKSSHELMPKVRA